MCARVSRMVDRAKRKPVVFIRYCYSLHVVDERYFPRLPFLPLAPREIHAEPPLPPPALKGKYVVLQTGNELANRLRGVLSGILLGILTDRVFVADITYQKDAKQGLLSTLFEGPGYQVNTAVVPIQMQGGEWKNVPRHLAKLVYKIFSNAVCSRMFPNRSHPSCANDLRVASHQPKYTRTVCNAHKNKRIAEQFTRRRLHAFMHQAYRDRLVKRETQSHLRPVNTLIPNHVDIAFAPIVLSVTRLPMISNNQTQWDLSQLPDGLRRTIAPSKGRKVEFDMREGDFSRWVCEDVLGSEELSAAPIITLSTVVYPLPLLARNPTYASHATFAAGYIPESPWPLYQPLGEEHQDDSIVRGGGGGGDSVKTQELMQWEGFAGGRQGRIEAFETLLTRMVLRPTVEMRDRARALEQSVRDKAAAWGEKRGMKTPPRVVGLHLRTYYVNAISPGSVSMMRKLSCLQISVNDLSST